MLVLISFSVSMAEERLLMQVECALTAAAAVKYEHSVALYRNFNRREEHISNFHSKDLLRLSIKKTVNSPTNGSSRFIRSKTSMCIGRL